MKAMHERYENVTPMGTMALCNTFGIAIFEPDEVDRYKDNCDLIAAWHNGECYYNFHKHMVHYTESGRAYIRKGSLRIYLDEITRIAQEDTNMKDFAKLNNRYLKLRKWLPQKLAYKLTIIYGMQEVEQCFMHQKQRMAE